MLDNIRLVRHQFKKMGVTIEFCTNGEQGLERVLEAERLAAGFDLVIMDICMPKMTGVECLRLLREAGCGAPVIMLSAHAMLEEQQRCYEMGASAYCTKPIDFQELFEICDSLLGLGDRRDAA